ncbi:hypothetical protein D0Z70_06685 [Sphingobium terrigena]|uniref:Uncharacterized protein n=1 Tax=Sphingobium terrigena TaxID=2304063 RepID=A0A418YV55_9SPHN|nr:hypothetical protein D0Z70_06685 [Sphingobium terrigena]
MEMAIAGPHFQIVKCGESGRLLDRAMSTLVPISPLSAIPLRANADEGKPRKAWLPQRPCRASIRSD